MTISEANLTKSDTSTDVSYNDNVDKNSKEVQRQQDQKPSTTERRRTITLELLRKRSEHNEGMVSTMEEIALHQEELESIGTTIGRTCGKTLQILLLQNNVISTLSLSEMKYFKVLRYLNLALNNLTKIQGLNYCYELQKIDLTLNFIDFDEFQASVQNLKLLPNLRELYFLGNPCCRASSSIATKKITSSPSDNKTNNNDDEHNENSNSNSRKYIVAMIPQLKQLDGREIHKSERILALQQLPNATIEIEQCAKQCQSSKCIVQEEEEAASTTKEDEEKEEMTYHTPEARALSSQKVAEQKAKKEEQQRASQPNFLTEKEWKEKQELAVQRERETNGNIRQRNEGKWTYRWDDEHPEHICLDVSVPRHLSTSLIDVDVHPTFLTIVIKSKVLRLKLPEEVKSGESKAQRSTITGHLLVTMPRMNPTTTTTKSLNYKHENFVTSIPQVSCSKPNDICNNLSHQQKSPSTSSSGSIRRNHGLFSEMLEEGCYNTGTTSTTSSSLTNVKTIVNKLPSSLKVEKPSSQSAWLSEVSTTITREQKAPMVVDSLDSSNGDFYDEDLDEPPPLL